MTPEEPAATEAAFVAALSAFTDVPGFHVIDEGDLLRTEAIGKPYTFLNGVLRLTLDEATAAERIEAVDAGYAALGLPASWWLTPRSRRSGIAAALVAAGKVAADLDEGMVIDLSTGPDALEEALERTPADLSIEPVETAADLHDWIDTMRASYGWTDPPKAAHLGELYDPRRAPERGRHQSVARLAGEAVACASIFLVDGIAWVTNIGTTPAARGRGIGAAITATCLARAASEGYEHAWLAASPMGGPVYRRLGFVETGPLVAYRATEG